MTVTRIEKANLELHNFKGRAYEFTADADEVQIDNVPNFRIIALNVQGMEAGDTIKIYGALTHEPSNVKRIYGDWAQILNASAVNPFIGVAGNVLEQIDISGLSNVKIVRTGAVAAKVSVQVSLSKEY